MRLLGRLGKSVCEPRNLFCIALVAVSVWAVTNGLIPAGPRPSIAVEARPVAGLTAPSPSDRAVSRVVSSLLKEHLTKHKLDDEISRRALDLFIKSLDGMKLYFYQTDIDEFNQKRNDLDDMVQTGNLNFAYTVFNRYLQRLDERVKMAKELLAAPIDSSADEVWIIDPDKLTHPANAAEAKARLLKRLKYEFLVLKHDKTNKEDVQQRLARRYDSLSKRMHQIDSNELLEMFLNSVTMAFDPHSNYMAPVSADEFAMQMSLHLEGIGAKLRYNDGNTVIEELIPGGAADKQGQIKSGDRIVSVRQDREAKPVDVGEMKLSDVVRLIRGRAGTLVHLGVMPADGGELKHITITRAKIELKDQEARGTIFEEGKKADGSSFKIGVINLPTFYRDMKREAEGADDFKSCSRDVRR